MSQAGYITASGVSPINPFGPLKVTIVTASATGPSFTYTVTSTDEFINIVSDHTIQVLLPDAPVQGRIIIIKDSSGTAKTNNISVTTVSGIDTIDGLTTQIIDSNYGSLTNVFVSPNYEIW